MAGAAPSIAQLHPLVESLGGMARELAAAGLGPFPLTGAEADRDARLAQRVNRLWPGLGAWLGPVLDSPSLERRVRDLEALADSLAGELSESRRVLMDGICRLQEEETAAREALAASEEDRREADRALKLAGEALEAAKAAEADLSRRSRALTAWVSSLEPLGSGRYRDRQGREISWNDLERAEARRQRVMEEMREAAARVKEAAKAQAAGREGLARARGLRDAAAKRLERVRTANTGQAAALRGRFRDLGGLESRLAETRRSLEEAGKRRDEYQTLISSLGQALGRLGAWKAPLEPLGALEEAEGAWREFLAEKGRLERLEALLERLGRRLPQRGGAAEEELKEARRLNREIKKEEERLAGLMEILAGPGGERAEKARATAEMPALLARLEALGPRAREVDARLENLRRAHDQDLDRARNLLEAWKEGARRAQIRMSEAQAALVEARHAGQGLAREVEVLRHRALPVLELLCGLSPRELAPRLQALTGVVERAGSGVLETERRSAELSGLTENTAVPGPGRPPLNLKEHTARRRRLSGRRVEVADLEAAVKSAAFWQGRAQGELSRAFARPSEEVALTLAASLGPLARERDQLARDLAQVTARAKAMGDSLRRLRGTTKDQSIARKDLARERDRLAGELSRIATRATAMEENLRRLREVTRDQSIRRKDLTRERDRLAGDLAQVSGWAGAMEQNLRRLREATRDQSIQRKDLTRERDRLAADLTEITSRSAVMEEDLRRLKELTRDQGAANQDLTLERDRLAGELAEITGRAAVMEEDLQHFRELSEERGRANHDLTGERDQLASGLTAVTARAAIMEVELRHLRAQTREQDTANRDMTGERDRLAGDLAHIAGRAGAMEKNLRRLREVTREQSIARKDLTRERDRLAGDLTEVSGRAAVMETDLSHFQELTREQDAANRDLTAERDRLARDLAQLAGRAGTMRTNLSRLREVTREQSVARRDIARQRDQLAGDLAMIAARARSMAGDLKRMRAITRDQALALKDLSQEHLTNSLRRGEAERRAADLTRALTRATAEVERLNGSLALITGERDRLAGDLLALTGRHEDMSRNITRLRAVTKDQSLRLKDLKSDLGQTTQERNRARAEAAGLTLGLQASREEAQALERSRDLQERRAVALKAKVLERQTELNLTRRALEEANRGWEESRRREKQISLIKAELAEARRELAESRGRFAEAKREGAGLNAQAAEAAAVKARWDLERIQTKSLTAELDASRAEAARWAGIARDLSVSLALAGQAHQGEREALVRKVEELSRQAREMEKQLVRLSLVVTLGPGSEAGDRAPDHLERLMGRLAAARRLLAKAGRSTITHLAVIAGVTGAMVGLTAGTPSTATLRDNLTVNPRPVLHQALGSLPRPEIRIAGPVRLEAQGKTLPGRLMQARTGINLLPLVSPGASLENWQKEAYNLLAAQAGLSPRAFMVSARNALPGHRAVEAEEMSRLAREIRVLAARHPSIFQELSAKGLPARARALADLPEPPEPGLNLFLDRMYKEYRSLGLSPDKALDALVENERAAAALRADWTPPAEYEGRVRPIAEVDALELPDFLDRMTPYIADRCGRYLTILGQPQYGDLTVYARNLAFDIYAAAHKFEVPASLLMAIAHQETWYANVLGDSNMSSSPFQIYRPTKHMINRDMAEMGMVPPPDNVKLEEHLTMATYMAAFHVRDLLMEATRPARGRQPAKVMSDVVMKRYNGSSTYAGMVQARCQELTGFMNGEVN